MQQWRRSDAFDLSSYVICKLLRCHWSYFILLQCLGGVVMDLLVTQDIVTKTVIKQWWDSDGTVMPLIWALQYHLQGFKMTLMIFYPFAMHLKCDYASAGDKRPFDKNSDQTVMRQWWNSDATVCSVTQDLLTKTVIKQKWDSDGTALHLILALRCHFQGFEMSLSIFYLFAMPWKCVWWHKT
jgi:hypothetical protein